ncbi:T9SS type A sorting domain-containing protein, partial [Aequorivita viscosa]
MGSILRKRLKTGGFLVLMFFAASIGWAQGLEDFTNSNAGGGYSTNSFIGNNEITWSYVESRDDNGTTGVTAPALMLRRVADESKVTSSLIPNGIGDFSVKLYKGFTGGGDRQVELFVNGISQGTSTAFDDYDEHIFTVSGINIEGDFTIEIRNTTSKQVIVDDITWTAFGEGEGNTGPFITNIDQTPSSTTVTSSDDVMVIADVVDGDGIASVELHWGTTSGSLTNIIAMSLDAGDTYMLNSAIPAQADGTTVYYEIQATDAHETPETSNSPEQSYTVEDPLPFTIPYSNAFGSQTDYDEAVGYGFIFNNTAITNYLRIDLTGSMTTAAIDFSNYNALVVSASMRTYGSGSGRELTVSVSDDNGVNYTTVTTFAIESSNYTTFEQLIDLSSLNGANGRIKFEMTSGSGSIRLRDFNLDIQEMEGYVYSSGAWSPFDPSGVSTSADDIVVSDGVATFTSDVEARNITINEGATLNVESVLSIAGDIINNGSLVFVSTATSNGELAEVLGTSSITGDVTVERYMKNKRSYRMISSAVTTTSTIHDNWQEGATSNTDNPNPGFGTHITGATTDQMNGFDGTITGNYSMFSVNVAAQMFEAVANTDVNTLTAGDAYLLFVRGDRSIDLTNDLAAGETVLRATGSLFTGTSTQNYATSNAGDILMFGNPYQSAVDVNSVFAASTNLNPGHYYVYDSELGAHGSYVTVMLPEGTNTSGSVANQFLQPGQGAQVATLAAGASSVVFNESDKAPGNFTATSRPATMNDMLTVQLYTTENFNNEGSLHDSFGIIFAEGNNNELTTADAVKPMNFYENLGIDHNGTYLSIEQRDMPQAAEVYSMYTTGYQQSEYTLKVIVDGLDSTVLYLDDHFTGTSTILEAGDNVYSFSVDANNSLSIATDRFSIRTEQRLGVDDNSLLSGIRLYPNPLNGDTFYINAPKLNGEQLLVSISDLTGRSIYEQTLDCSANTVTVPMAGNIASGVYLVTLNHGGEAHTFR